MAVTRSGLLAAESSADKIATFIEWVNQLQNKQAVTAYLQTATFTANKPTLIKGNKSSKTNKSKNTLSSPKQTSPFDQEEFPEEREEDDMNFLFGEEDNDEEFGR